MSRTAVTQAVLEVPFRIDSINEVEAPDGADGVWQSYVICQGTNRITGMRCGTRGEVVLLLEEMVERLNERRLGKRPKPKG